MLFLGTLLMLASCLISHNSVFLFLDISIVGSNELISTRHFIFSVASQLLRNLLRNALQL